MTQASEIDLEQFRKFCREVAASRPFQLEQWQIDEVRRAFKRLGVQLRAVNAVNAYRVGGTDARTVADELARIRAKTRCAPSHVDFLPKHKGGKR